MVCLHRQFFKERFLLSYKTTMKRFWSKFMTLYFPNPLKELFQRIAAHRKERERGKRQTAAADSEQSEQRAAG